MAGFISMLSYRHAFHAGNHADVLKHFVEIQLLRHLSQKDKAFWYIDTHAGAGCYALDSGYATQNEEFSSGIARLWEREDLPPALADYVALVRGFNPDGVMKLYPGSPMVAQQILRNQDRMRLFEMHPSDCVLLQKNFGRQGTQVLIQTTDGFQALKSLLPPPPKRALVLIDPPYEDKQDYRRVVSALNEGLKRFATGVYALWYPQLLRFESSQLPEKLKRLPAKSWLHVALSVQGSDTAEGMRGSGMFVINPPWWLQETLHKVLPYLVRHLAQDEKADFVLEYYEKPV
ncbi:MAG: 23S rRNA (adenine(2030)-N(6))-methyltransferase RlmJ [Xanthomonadales bacterium]|nr:23S rRNA (adenine(2030)-N(6))-methyltransferase RlmJ [Xanthomonadales bacterium]